MNGNSETADTTAAAESPNDILAGEVADALVDAGLITGAHKAAILDKLKSGGVSQDDWNLWVDIATSPSTNEEEVRNE